jgi:hypothetical protein
MKQYEILRHINFYAVGNEVSLEDLGKFFTKMAIESFIEYGFIKEI